MALDTTAGAVAAVEANLGALAGTKVEVVLAAFAGIYLGLTQDVAWNMGQRLLLVLFAAVTLGGLGTIWGAIVGALVVGMFVQLSTLVVPTEMKTVGALFVMIVILLIRPQGILGRRERVG